MPHLSTGTYNNQGRRQKNFQVEGGPTKKKYRKLAKKIENSTIKLFQGGNEKKTQKKQKRLKKSTIKPLSTISVPCIKIQGGMPLPPPFLLPPTPMTILNKFQRFFGSISGETCLKMDYFAVNSQNRQALGTLPPDPRSG